MAISFSQNYSLNRSSTAKEFADMVIDVVYPMLFEQINELLDKILLLEKTEMIDLLRPQLSAVTLAWDAMQQKENKELFPLIMQLDLEQRKSGSCKPFKHINTYYVRLLTLYQHLKISVAGYLPKALANSKLALISDSVDILEKYIIGIQSLKEKNLFSRFRSCTGCKSLEALA